MSLNLDEIEKALGETTQGEWFVDHEHPRYCINLKGEDALRHIAMVSCFDYYYGAAEENIANAHLIAHAPEWLRLLVERVRKLEAIAEEYQWGLDVADAYNIAQTIQAEYEASETGQQSFVKGTDLLTSLKESI